MLVIYSYLLLISIIGLMYSVKRKVCPIFSVVLTKPHPCVLKGKTIHINKYLACNLKDRYGINFRGLLGMINEITVSGKRTLKAGCISRHI